MYNYQANMDARDARRGKAQDRFLTRLEKRETEAEALVGHLNSGKFYINVRNARGQMTGATREFTSEYEAIAFLLRNNYV